MKEKEEREQRTFNDIFNPNKTSKVEDALEFNKSKRNSLYIYPPKKYDINLMMSANRYKIANDIDQMSLIKKFVQLFLSERKPL